MPYLLKHHQTAEIYACMQTNKYDLPYYGVLHRDAITELESATQSLLRDSHREDWTIIEVDEAKVKLWNVKLRNDPRLKLFVDEHGNVSLAHPDA